MINGKSIILLQSIIDNNGIKSLKELSIELDIGDRAIRYEIDKLNEYLGVKLKLSKGIVEIENVDLIGSTLKTKYNIKLFSPKEREEYVYLEILLKRVINQGKLSENLDISRNTLKIYLKTIKNNLRKYDLKLEILPKKGLVLVGKEENIRVCTLNFLNSLENNKNQLFKQILMKNFEINENGIISFINYCQKLLDKKVSDEAYKLIKKYINISMIMIKNKNEIEDIYNKDFLETTIEYKIIKKAGALLESNYDIEISKIEYLKITELLLESHTYDLKYSHYENWLELGILIKKMIYKFSKKIEIDITNDKTLLDGLFNGLKYSVYKIQNKIESENNIYNDVVTNYFSIFEISKELTSDIEKRMNINFSNDDIAIIAINFKAAIDRARVIVQNNKRILIVSDKGYGISKFLAQQLKDIFSIEIIDIIPKYTLSLDLKKENIDMIITTTSLDKFNLDIPIIKVNSVLTTEDIEFLKRNNFQNKNKKYKLSELIAGISRNCTINDREGLVEFIKKAIETNLIEDIIQRKNSIFDTFDEKFISSGEFVKNWEEATIKVGELLLKNNCIEKTYIDELVNSIKSSNNCIVWNENTIFVYTDSDKYVKRKAFSILVLKNSILFPNNILVKTVVAFSLKDMKEGVDILFEVLKIMEDQGFNMDKFVQRF